MQRLCSLDMPHKNLKTVCYFGKLANNHVNNDVKTVTNHMETSCTT